MSAGTVVTLSEYLATSYRPDCEYLDGELLERNEGTIGFGVPWQSCSSLLHACSGARPSVLCLPRTSRGKEKKVSLFRLLHSARLPRRGLRALRQGRPSRERRQAVRGAPTGSERSGSPVASGRIVVERPVTLLNEP